MVELPLAWYLVSEFFCRASWEHNELKMERIWQLLLDMKKAHELTDLPELPRQDLREERSAPTWRE